MRHSFDFGGTMSIKAFSARLVGLSEEERAALWRTHRVFNEQLCVVLRQMNRMKRGEPDPRHAEIFKAIKSAQGASRFLEAVTSIDWKPKQEKGEWQKIAADLIREGILLFDRNRNFEGLGKHRFHRRLFDGSFQILIGHQELVALWKQDHVKWQKEKDDFEQENPEYMKIRPVLEAFEAEHGKAAKRRQRWHKWLAFLRNSPNLAAWRGGEAVIHEINEDAKKRIDKARRNKRNKIESEEFYKANPAIKELDPKHGYYQREYVRLWAKRRNSDGFKHRPTFTEPSAEKHPFWFSFQKNDQYKKLDLKSCIINIPLLSEDESKYTWKRYTLKFKLDRRLRDHLRQLPPDRHVGKGKTKYSYIFSDKELSIDRPAEIRGAKLIFRPARPDGKIYLSFTCETPDLPGRLSIKQQSCDKYSTQWVYKETKKILDQIDPITLAVDLGIRHLGAATVRRDGKIVRSRFVREENSAGSGPRLSSIKNHKRNLSKIRKKRGKPIKGEESCIELQKHVNDMSEDRFKKGARRIVNFAFKNGCDLIIMERLGGLIPDAEKERGINRALINWNRGNIVKWVKQLANDAGIRVVEVYPHWTSQLCSRCGSMGARFTAEKGILKFEQVGKMFACPDCGYIANGDHNASVNLHKRFFNELPDVKKLKNGKYQVSKKGELPKEVDFDDIKNRVISRADAMCRGVKSRF